MRGLERGWARGRAGGNKGSVWCRDGEGDLIHGDFARGRVCGRGSSAEAKWSQGAGGNGMDAGACVTKGLVFSSMDALGVNPFSSAEFTLILLFPPCFSFQVLSQAVPP